MMILSALLSRATMRPCKRLWQRIADNGRDDIYKDSYKGWYSVRDEAFYTEDELTPDDEGALSCRRKARRWNGWKRIAISFACRPMKINYWRILRPIRFLHARKPPQRGGVFH